MSNEQKPAIPDEDKFYQEQMILLCGEDFVMQAGFQRGWLVQAKRIAQLDQKMASLKKLVDEYQDLWRREVNSGIGLIAECDAERQRSKTAERALLNCHASLVMSITGKPADEDGYKHWLQLAKVQLEAGKKA